MLKTRQFASFRSFFTSPSDSLFCFLFAFKDLMVTLGSPWSFRIISHLKIITSARSLLPSNITYSEVLGIRKWTTLCGGHYSITTPKHHTLLNNHPPPAPRSIHISTPNRMHIWAVEKKSWIRLGSAVPEGNQWAEIKFSTYKFHGSEIFRSFPKQKGCIVTLSTCVEAEEHLLNQERGWWKYL